ncbi:MAG: alpha/beta hydrolase [Chloroflexi bacterium]|nr:alpha/beta hydrolase [Chloroflexota bacterium]
MALLRMPGRSEGEAASMQIELPAGKQLALRDGRRLGYLEYGDPKGRVLFFFHGFGSTRLMRHPDESIPAELGVRVISVDRPGIGLSDPKPGRALLDWPADVAAMADALGIGRFAVLGWSGGGPYALACAWMLPERVTSAGVISGPAPLVHERSGEYLKRRQRGAVRLAFRVPWVLRLALWRWGRPQRRDPVASFDSAVEGMIASDQQLMADPRLREIMIENASEVYRQGGRGMYDEGRILTGPWGFRPESVRAEVHLWHGDLDDTVPAEMGRHLARTIPGCRASFYPTEGHHLLYHRWREILLPLARSLEARPDS